MNEPVSTDNPQQRLTAAEIDDLRLCVQSELSEDTRLALENNFPAEQLQPWKQVQEGLSTGWMNLHELRSKSSNTLLSARLMVVYHARKRGEHDFILVAWVVTPDPAQNSRQGKGRGYGSYLRPLSYQISKSQNPHALGLVAEREAPDGSAAGQSVKRASWMKRIGLLRIADLNYEIPPYMTVEERGGAYVPVENRQKRAKLADLLLTRFDEQRTVAGKVVYSLVERMYTEGYAVRADDPYLRMRLDLIDQNKVYDLVEN